MSVMVAHPSGLPILSSPRGVEVAETLKEIEMVKGMLHSIERRLDYLRANVVGGQAQPRPEEISRLVANYWQIPIPMLYGKSTSRHVIAPREANCYLIRRVLGMAYQMIGRHLNMHHTTVLHAVDRAQIRLNRDPIFRLHVERIERHFLGQQLPVIEQQEAMVQV